MRLTAGGIRELHWNTAGEWPIMLYGNARIKAIDLDGKSFVSDVTGGDLGYFSTGIPHFIPDTVAQAQSAILEPRVIAATN